MVNSDLEEISIGYDKKRETPYFCNHPPVMSCEAHGFTEFYFMLMIKLNDGSNRGAVYRMPRKEDTNLDNVEFDSLRTVFEQHNR